MGYIHCCGGMRETKSFSLFPSDGFVLCDMDILAECPVCGHYVIQLTRIDNTNSLSTIRLTNNKARKFWSRAKSKIMYEHSKYDGCLFTNRGTFYLGYSEFGVKKRCYSNLSNLRLGIS